MERHPDPTLRRIVAGVAAEVLRCAVVNLSFPGKLSNASRSCFRDAYDQRFWKTAHSQARLQATRKKFWVRIFFNNFFSPSVLCWNLLSLHLQIKWCGSVFKDPVSIVCQLLTESLEGMEPSHSSCLEEFLKNRESQLQSLIDIKQAGQTFLVPKSGLDLRKGIVIHLLVSALL